MQWKEMCVKSAPRESFPPVAHVVKMFVFLLLLLIQKTRIFSSTFSRLYYLVTTALLFCTANYAKTLMMILFFLSFFLLQVNHTNHFINRAVQQFISGSSSIIHHATRSNK